MICCALNRRSATCTSPTSSGSGTGPACLGSSGRARSHCRFVLPTHPLYTRINTIFGASFSETTMRPNPIVRGSLFAGCRDAVRARPGRFSGLSVLPSNSLFNGALFVWARSVLNSQKRRFPARADEPGHPLRPLARHRARGVRPGPARARSHYNRRRYIWRILI
jgi:hypothetical protein